MTRRDTDQINLARARADLLCGKKHPRIAGRTNELGRLEQVQDQVILALSNSANRAIVTDFAAAAFHGRQIAKSISGTARSEMAQHINGDARRFALAHQNLADAAEIDTDFGSAFSATKDRVDIEIALTLQDAAPQYPAERDCLTAALSEVTK